MSTVRAELIPQDTAGSRQLANALVSASRLLASVPFGYRSPEHEEADLATFRELLVG